MNLSKNFACISRTIILVALICQAEALVLAKGFIVGQVSNAATSAFLEGAEISVVGSSAVVLTDRVGSFEIALNPGPTTLVINYTGLETKRVTVVVTEGLRRVENIALSSGIYKLDAFTVSGPREGGAAAITKQREAANVKNVVASDSFGNVADGNIGDFLQQLPGITAVYVGADVRSVQIRGIDGALNSVTMDGDRVASSQSAAAGRTFEFEQASLNNIETIEVTKAPTPDMDADSIGGNVNIVSKSAFGSNQPRMINYSLAGVYRPKYYTRSDSWLREPIANVGPSVNFSYADQLGSEKRLGVMLNLTYHSQPGGDTASLANYQASLAEPYYTQNITVPRPAGAPRTRLALGGKLEYKLSERTTLTLNMAYNWFHETNDTRGMLLGTTAATTNFKPGYTSFFEEVIANPNSSSAVTLTIDDKSGRTYQFVPTIRHRFNSLDIDYGVSLSNSQTYYDYAPSGRHFQSRPKGSITYKLPNIGFTIDRRENQKWPTYAQTSGPDLYNLNNYNTLLLTQSDRMGEDEVRTAKLNAKKSFDWGTPFYVKLGGVVRQQERGLTNNSKRYNYTGADGIQNNDDDLGSLGQFIDLTRKWSDSNAGYRSPAWANPFSIARHQAEHPELWREDAAFTTSSRLIGLRSITETVSSAYAMGNLRWSKLSILGGVRIERTETDAEGPITIGSVIQRVSRKGSYADTFPGLHLRYEPTRNLISRLSYSSGIGRPSFDALMPSDNVNVTTQTVTLRNPSLNPQYSDNFDATLEYYFEPVGSLSASTFLKQIEGFQYTDTSQFVGTGQDNGFDGQYAGYRISTTRNGGKARYRGVEFAYQQQFTFLPGFWRGFGAYANYTKLETRGDYGGTTVTTNVAGFVPKTANVALTYLGHGFNLRLNAVWRSEYLVTNSTNPAAVVYQEPKLQLNFKSRYQVTRTTAVFCDIENLNHSPITETWVGSKDRPNQTRIVVAKIVAGISGRF